MHSDTISGFLLAFCLANLVAFGICAARCLRGERAPALRAFSLHSLAVAVATGCRAALCLEARIGAPDAPTWLAVEQGARVIAAVTLLRFVALHLEVARARTLLRVGEALAAVAVLALVLGGLGAFTLGAAAPPVVEPVEVLGLSLAQLDVPRGPVATALGALTTGAAALATTWLARARLRDGKREALAAALGAGALAVAHGVDALHDAGAGHGLDLVPFGHVSLTTGLVVMLTVQFITAGRRELETRTTELNRQSEELRRSSEELRRVRSELIRKEDLAAVGELAAVIAHEVRNPLAIISNAVAGLRRRELPESDRGVLLGILDEEATRLNRLVSDLLHYARPVNLEPQTVALREIVERAVGMARAEPGIVVELEQRGEVGGIPGDPGLLRQVFENLVSNAVQAMARDGGTLWVTLEAPAAEGPGVCVTLEDTGEGMNTQVRSRALDPFFTTRPSGTGLGLAIVERIIEAHGGRLSILSAAGEGTVVSVFLPARPPNAAESGARSRVGVERRVRVSPLPVARALRHG